MTAAPVVTAPPDTERARATVLAACGAGEREIEELLAYNRNTFASSGHDSPWPLPDEPFAVAWRRYAAEAEAEGAAAVLRRHLVQLRFPVSAGVSASETYRAATRRGDLDGAPREGIAFRDPEGLRLFIHPTAAGHIGVVVARARADFVTLVRALTRQNEPVEVPASQGACIVAGFNNWSRVADERRSWERANPGAPPAAWAAAFRALVSQRERYQDRFIVLSSGPYSGVPARTLDLADDVWLRLSLTIRLEHECAHYVTRRALGSMRNALLDELIADYTGITAATGRFDARWFLTFLGLDSNGYREGGRLENYRGDPPLSPGAVVVLGELVRRAARSLASIDADGIWGTPMPDPLAERARRIRGLARLTLEEIAGPADGTRELLSSSRECDWIPGDGGDSFRVCGAAVADSTTSG